MLFHMQVNIYQDLHNYDTFGLVWVGRKARVRQLSKGAGLGGKPEVAPFDKYITNDISLYKTDDEHIYRANR